MTGLVTRVNWRLGDLVRHGDSPEGFAMDAMAKFVSAHNVEKLVYCPWRSLGGVPLAKERIRAQKRIIEGLRVEGYDIASAECLLNNLVGIERIFKQHRQVILDSINRNRL